MAMPDEWTELAYVAISDNDGNQYQFGALTDTIDIPWGSRDIEAIATVSSGRVVKKVPDDVTELALELFPVGMSSNSTIPNGVHAWFMGLAPTATSGINQLTRKKFRVTILWTDLAFASVTDAAGAIASANSYRVSFWGCHMTNASMEFTDDILKSKVTFKCVPFDKSSAGLIKSEEAVGATLATLGAFDGSAPS